jgi:hypothetical protein
MKKPLIRAALGCAMFVLAAGPAAAQFGFLNFANQRNAGPQQDRDAVTKAAAGFAAQHEEWARPLLTSLYADGEWGAVLNFKRLGLAAMERQKFALARRAFDEAIARVEEIYADDANARKARSVFNAEAVKDFKGEPYERAMLYYYRGLLYVHEGDFQNARAAFLAADRHVTLSSAEAAGFKSDFGMLKYLAGWASYCDNDAVRGEHLVSEAREMDTRVQALPQSPANSLLLVETGPAPQKWGDGEHKQILKFKPGDGPVIAPRVRTGTGLLDDLPVAADIVYQATTRGGREVDGIMAGKATFKQNAGAVGDTAMNVGLQAAMIGSMSGNRDVANAGLAGMFIGLIAKSAEAAANPAADTRSWDTLPAQVHLFTARGVAQGQPVLVVDEQARPMPLVAAHQKCSLAWGRTTSAMPTPFAPDAAFNPETNRGDRNKALRHMLQTDFTRLD